jgi:hypothetical protein
VDSRVSRVSARTWYLIAVAAAVAAACIQLAMGRVLICKCGYVRLWVGTVQSAENSQQLTDWYTFTHIVHGFLFYFLTWLLARRLPPPARLALATVLEASWEVLENTNFVIDRYRAVTISLDYYGDSVINSMSDIAAMVVGFLLARRLPVAGTVTLAVAMEIFLAFMIHDNLTLNVLMLIYPVEAIRHWQMGG